MSSFVSDFLKTGGGNALTQAISILTIPIITRLYSPSEYGIYATVIALSVIAIPLLALRYNTALLIPRLRANTRGLIWLSGITSLFMGLLLFLVALLGVSTGLAEKMLGAEVASHIGWLLAIVLIAGFSLNFQMVAVKDRRFSLLAVSRIFEIGLERSLSLAAGLLGFTAAINLLLARAVGALSSGLIFFFNLRGALVPRPGTRRMRRLAIRYRSFPLSSAPATLIDSLSRQLPLVIMTAFLSPHVVGCYALALQLVNMPLVLLGDALASVYLNRAAAHRSDSLYIAQLSTPIIRISILVFLPFALFLNTTGQPLFSYVFGADWADAGVYAGITSLAIGIMFIHRILGSLFEISEKTRVRLWFDATLFVIKIVGTFVLCKAGFSAGWVILFIAASNFLVYLAGILYVARNLLSISIDAAKLKIFMVKLAPAVIIAGWITAAKPGVLLQGMAWLALALPLVLLHLKSEYTLLKSR